MSCCSKMICFGCCYTNKLREMAKMQVQTCPFCRLPSPATQTEADENRMKRVEANDEVAISQKGSKCYFEGNWGGAFEYWTKAADLGYSLAHYHLSVLYHSGLGVDRDKKKEAYHLEQAAIGGHPQARHKIGIIELALGNDDRAVKHFIIAAKLGFGDSMKRLWELYAKGYVKKEDLVATLHQHQAAVDEAKSPQRDAAEVRFLDAWLLNWKS